MVVVGEAAAIVAVVGWFVSPNIAMLMEVARSCASAKYNRLSDDIKAKLQKLAGDLEDIKASLDPASMGFVNDPTSIDRLWRLKDGIHDAEEILDLFQLEILQAEAENQHAGAKRGSLGQLEKVVENLHQRARELHQDPHRLHGISPISIRPATAPCPVKDKRLFFGYDEEYNQLLLSVLPDGNKDMSKAKATIAIVGHGGMGKTELARQLFRDVKGKFDLRIWVHAYDKLAEFDLLKEIWKSAAGAGNSRPVSDMSLSSLQRELKKLLKSKRCLLVLDDVWNHEGATSEMERKQARVALDLFLGFVGDGSRVVVTTRAMICSATLGAGASIVLNGIGHEQVMLLFQHTAKLAVETRIQELLNKQVDKLKGSPLGAIEVGDELREKAASRSKLGWCECDMILRDMEHHMGSVFSCHLFTYQHLPPHLQRCFAFCSIFPLGWRFEPEKLTRMWIAHGFVEDTHLRRPAGGKSMEDVARGYLEDLVHRSLFQREACSSCREDNQSRYVIHDHIHWMLRRASAKHCISITRSSVPTSIPTTVRHLSVTAGCLDHLKAYPTGVSNVRTLLVIEDDDDDPAPSIAAIGKGILEQFTGVRVVDFTETAITQLPETIGKLTHVRYLGLPCTIMDLCHQVTRLLFLQTLSVSEQKKGQVRLPDDMNRLINMRHLDVHPECIANIGGIGRMTKLQGSLEFHAVKGSEKAGHSVSELAGMNCIGGTLSIKGLDAVASKEEAMESCLAKKSSVKVLKLQWRGLDPRQVNGGPAAGVAAAAVLEGLQPHADLHDLRIARYPGATWPSWLAVLEKLTCLYLWNCRKLRALPPLGGLPCLEILDIKELTSVERIDGDFCGGGAFPKLKKIVLDDMPVLVAWGDMPKKAFSRLRELSIFHCPILSSLSGLECCGGPLHLSVMGCPAITPATLPANFSAGASTCEFW